MDHRATVSTVTTVTTVTTVEKDDFVVKKISWKRYEFVGEQNQGSYVSCFLSTKDTHAV
jgi:hypothetical protein